MRVLSAGRHPVFVQRMRDVAYTQQQCTLAQSAICAGVGVHSGVRARIALRPAVPDSGIRFLRTDLDAPGDPIPAHATCVTDVKLGTTLSNDQGVTVAVVEHLLAACAGMGIDNLLIEIDGPEVPIMDGSAAVFCDLIRAAGVAPQAALRRRIRVLETVEVQDGAKWARLAPSDATCLSLDARIDFETAAIGEQHMALDLTPGLFARDVAHARTFGFARDVAYLQSIGLARGGSLDNAVVIDGDQIMNPEGLRCEDEFVRHKLLDAIGDLMLAGAPLAGAYSAYQPGHAMNNKLVRALLAAPEAWCWEEASEIGLRASA